MSYSVQVKADCISLIDLAERESKKPGADLDYYRGIKKAAEIILLKHAWHVLTPAEKRRFDAKREKEEREERNAKAKGRRAEKMARVAHLHNYFKDSVSGDEWKRYGDSPECDARRGLGQDERAAWPESNRLVLDPSEATCRECLDSAIEKKIPGAEEQLRKLWRKEEAEAMRRGR